MNSDDPNFTPFGSAGQSVPPLRRESPWPTSANLVNAAILAGLIFIGYQFVSLDQAAPADVALHEAVGHGDVAAARQAIAAGADVRHTNLVGSTLLHTAAWRGDLAMATLLIERGALVNAADTRSGETPLHSAARGNRAEMVDLLLAHGANADLRTFADSEQCNGRIYSAGVSALDIARLTDFDEVARRLPSPP